MSRKLSTKPAARAHAKSEVVAFKVESELAELLNQLPNKSAFIRKAIVAQLGMACPLCIGTGVVARGVHDHFAPLIAQFNHRSCEGCGDDLPLPREAGELTEEHRDRLEQFFRGGPLYCDPCYEKAATCNSCGWHIAPDRFADHHRQAHADE